VFAAVWSLLLKPLATLGVVAVAALLVMVAVDWLAEWPTLSVILTWAGVSFLQRTGRARLHATHLAQHVRVMETPGAVYILTNPDLPGCVKIGMTTGSVHRRAESVTRDYRLRGKVRRAFVVARSVRTATPRGLEKAMHGVFSARNIAQGAMEGGRELFYVPVEEAAAMLDHLSRAVEGDIGSPQGQGARRRFRLAG
jgi:hypothetical protein